MDLRQMRRGAEAAQDHLQVYGAQYLSRGPRLPQVRQGLHPPGAGRGPHGRGGGTVGGQVSAKRSVLSTQYLVLSTQEK